MKRDTNRDLMEAIHSLAEKSGCYERAKGIMDYYLPVNTCCEDIQEITNYEFDFRASVKFGGSEGIYLDCYIEGEIDDSGEEKRLRCGTYKTLRDDLEAMQIMGELAGSLTYYNSQYVNGNIDRYSPEAKQ